MFTVGKSWMFEKQVCFTGEIMSQRLFQRVGYFGCFGCARLGLSRRVSPRPAIPASLLDRSPVLPVQIARHLPPWSEEYFVRSLAAQLPVSVAAKGPRADGVQGGCNGQPAVLSFASPNAASRPAGFSRPANTAEPACHSSSLNTPASVTQLAILPPSPPASRLKCAFEVLR